MIQNHVSSDDLRDNKRFKPVEFKNPMVKANLYTSLCIPSYTQAYSLCISYIKNWFLSVMPKDYFKSVYIEGKHALDEFKNKNINQLLKKPKPSLAIIPQFDYNFDNEDLNWQYGNKFLFARITHGKDIIFSDKKNNVHISAVPQLLMANIMFKIRVNTKAKQMDLFNYMSSALGDRGVTRGMYIQLDYDVPDELMLQLAKDMCFDIEDGKIKDNIAFLKYLNSNSNVPFLFKLKNINGKRSYFIRIPSYVHMREPDDLNLDEGERQGQVTSNFIIEYEVQVRFPSIRCFKYSSLHHHENIKVSDEDGNVRAIYTNYNSIPDTNSQGWAQYMTTDYEEENLDKPLEIEFKELLEGQDLAKVIEFSNQQKLSPSGYVEINLYNDGRNVPLDIDWKNMKLTTVGLVTAIRSRIVIYSDNVFVTEQLTSLKGWDKNRINSNPEQYKTI